MHDPSKPGAADILVPVHNDYPSTRRLLEGIYRHTDYPFQIYLIDNASTDETADLHKVYTRNITVVRNRRSRGWSGAINQGLRMGTHPYVVFMTNDVELSVGWLGNMIAFLNTHPRIAAVGPLNSSEQDWQFVDRIREQMVPQIPKFFTDDIHERNRILQYHFHQTGVLVEGTLSFFCTVLARRAIDDVGLLEEGTGAGPAGYCRRLRQAGYVLGLSLDTYVVRHAASGVKVSRTLPARRSFRKLPVSV